MRRCDAALVVAGILNPLGWKVLLFPAVAPRFGGTALLAVRARSRNRIAVVGAPRTINIFLHGIGQHGPAAGVKHA
jgi:hypothetical protein